MSSKILTVDIKIDNKNWNFDGGIFNKIIFFYLFILLRI